MIDVISNQIQDSIAVKQALLMDNVLLKQIESLAITCLDSLKDGGKIILCGNGGSFADAQHISAEFTSRLQFDRAPLSSLALGTNNSAMSAIGNDYGYDQIFARELRAIAKPLDVLIGISTSGDSPNIISAIEVANELGIHVVAWTGLCGGRLTDHCECLRVPSTHTARIQECHILIGHIMCGLVESIYFNDQCTAMKTK